MSAYGNNAQLQLVKGSAHDQDALAMLRKRIDFSSTRPERYVFEELWLKNMAFFSGKQHIYIENGRIAFDRMQDIAEHKVFYKVNLCSAALVRAAAKVLNINATFKAVPESGSIRHRNIAETSERLFAHIRGQCDWGEKVSLLGTMTAGICGSGFYKVYWNQLAGRADRFYLARKGSKEVVPNAVLDRASMAEKDRDGLYQDVAQGDVQVRNQLPFATFHDWTSRDEGVAGCQWMADAHWLDKALIAEMHDVDEDDLTSDEQSRGLANYEEAIAFMSSFDFASPYMWTDVQDKQGKRCRYVDYYERPCRKYPRGRRIVQAGGRILVNGPNPYAGDLSKAAHLPYVKQDWLPHPGRFYGRSLLEDLTNPNYYVNQSRSALLELMKVFGRPRTYTFPGSGLDPRKLVTDPGGVFELSGVMAKPPAYDPPVTVSPEVANIGALCMQDMNMVASQSEIDGAKMPNSLRSGEAMKQMIEYRDIALTVPGKQSVLAARDVGRAALSICKLYYNEARVLRYLGDDGEWNFKDFIGADLSNDVIVTGEPSILDTEASRRAEIMDAINVGALNPAENPTDRIYALSELHYGDSDHAIKAKLRAQKSQEDAIRTMVADPQRYAQQGYPVFEWEDHQGAIEVSVNFMYSDEFKRLEPIQQSVITVNWKKHLQALQLQQMQQVAMLAQTKGAPGQKGRASQAK